jgi:hypothetical protein
MTYSGLVFLPAFGLFGVSGLAFLGRPGLGVLRMASRTSGAYIAVGPEYPMGFIPALSRRFLAVLGFIPNAVPISLASKPFGIFIISDYIKKKIKKIENLRQFILTYCQRNATI